VSKEHPLRSAKTQATEKRTRHNDDLILQVPVVTLLCSGVKNPSDLKLTLFLPSLSEYCTGLKEGLQRIMNYSKNLSIVLVGVVMLKLKKQRQPTE
jgi:hypothetical protein